MSNTMMKSPGFGAIQKNIAMKEGIPLKNAGAILAAATRGASKAAHIHNPHLNKVRGII